MTDVKELVATAKECVRVAEARVAENVFGAYDRNFIVNTLIAQVGQLADALEALSQQRGCDGPDDLLAGLASVSGRDPRTIRIDFHDIDAANRVFDWLTELNPVLASPSPTNPHKHGEAGCLSAEGHRCTSSSCGKRPRQAGARRMRRPSRRVSITSTSRALMASAGTADRSATFDPHKHGEDAMITMQDQVRCVQREIMKRKSVYPRLVAEKRMSQEKADRELATMEAVLLTVTAAETASRLI